MSAQRGPVLRVLSAILGADRHTKNHRHLQNAAGHCLPLCQLVEDFIAAAADEVAVHQLDNSSAAAYAIAHSGTDDS